MTTVKLALADVTVVKLEVDDLDCEFWIGRPTDPATSARLAQLFPGRAPVRVTDGPAAGRTSGAFLARHADGIVVLHGEESFSPSRR